MSIVDMIAAFLVLGLGVDRKYIDAIYRTFNGFGISLGGFDRFGE